MAMAGRNSEQFSLRFPAGLRDSIKEAAEANGRSMNSEIIVQLMRVYEREASNRTEKSGTTA